MNLEQQREHYRAVRARIASARPRSPASEPEPEPVPQPLPRVPPLPVSATTRTGLRHLLLAYGVTWSDVISDTRRKCYEPPRRAVYWLLHCAGVSTVQIGRFTRRNHATIIHSLKKVNSWK